MEGVNEIMTILTKSEIRKLILENDMIVGYDNLSSQLQPNGFDLRLDEVFKYDGRGIIFNNDKTIPDYKKIDGDKRNETVLYDLKVNNYSFNIMETIKLPLDICAFTVQRSSIMRCGCITNVGWWDSGYNGKGFSQLMVNNPYGFIIEKGAKIIQMIFMKNTKKTDGYKGSYQLEGVKNG